MPPLAAGAGVGVDLAGAGAAAAVAIATGAAAGGRAAAGAAGAGAAAAAASADASRAADARAVKPDGTCGVATPAAIEPPPRAAVRSLATNSCDMSPCRRLVRSTSAVRARTRAACDSAVAVAAASSLANLRRSAARRDSAACSLVRATTSAPDELPPEGAPEETADAASTPLGVREADANPTAAAVDDDDAVPATEDEATPPSPGGWAEAEVVLEVISQANA